MNFDFSDEQRAIKDTAREFLASRYPLTEARRMAEEEGAGYDLERWREICELGWPGIFVPEEEGGQGLGIVELVILQEELGYALAPTPFFSNACAALVLQAAGARDRLPALAGGEQRATVAVVDEEGTRTPDACELVADGSRLTGTKVLVHDAQGADFLVVAVRERPYVVEADADGVTVAATPGLDPTRGLHEVRFEGVEGSPLEPNEEIALMGGAMAVALAAESVGVAQRAMEMAVEYAKERKQFERPIGAYQAVSHRCAQMLLEVEGARSVTYYAAWALDNEPQSAMLAASMAKAYASDAGWRVTASALQVLGGIGFTWEHDLHLLLKRAKANAHAFGDARWHREQVAELAPGLKLVPA
jgi:alkylation response protein AidB-like acyl-CoA dehydrogenase